MEELDISKALELLKSGFILVDERPDNYYILKGDIIIHHHKGSRFKLSLDDFIVLYAKQKFYIYEAPIGVDDIKDQEYYAFKHK